MKNFNFTAWDAIDEACKHRICDVFDKDLNGTLDIKEFASIYSVFSARATREQKLQFAFKVESELCEPWFNTF